MARHISMIVGVLALTATPSAAGAAEGSDSARAQLDARVIQADLRTADPDEEAYITYVVTLVNQGRLPRALVESTFLWARRKPVGSRKFQYFKRALLLRAARVGIRLPQGTPTLTPTINGRVTVRVLGVDLPAASIVVRIEGTKRKTLTNLKGRFTFEKVPLGTHVLVAQGVAAFLPRKGTVTVVLPPDPPKTDSIFVQIPLK